MKNNNSKNNSKNNSFGSAILLGATVAVLSFVLNLIWENAQAPFYQGYENFGQHFWICLPATVWDVVIIVFIYSIIALIHRDSQWIVHSQSLILKCDSQGIIQSRQSLFLKWKTIIPSLILGFIIAVFIEKRALIEGRWGYTANMPLISLPIPFIPGGDIALFPVLQMIILPLLTFYLVQKMYSLGFVQRGA